MKSKSVIYISLTIDLLIAISKFTAAAFTGSASMVSEGVHSIIDAISQVLLIWGIKTSTRQPDADRPYGYGKELYFWSFIVSLMIFVLGGCVSFYEGFMRLGKPTLDGNEIWNYSIILIALIFTGFSFYASMKVFNKQRGDKPFWEAVRLSKDPSILVVLLGDVGDILGLLVAFLGVFLGKVLHKPYMDSIASMVIGLILVTISGILVRESKSLLMGETTSPKTLRKIRDIAQADEAVIKVKGNSSMYLSPEEIMLHMRTVFKANLTTKQITDAIERITKSIRDEFPKIKQIFIEPIAK